MSSEFSGKDSIEYETGDVVTDREKDKEVVVVEATEERCDECAVFETPGDDPPVTVAYYNSDYPADDHVVEAVYLESSLWGAGDEFRRAVENGEIADGEVYSFPASRLEKEG